MQTNPISRTCFTSPEVYVLVNEKAVAEPRLFHWLATDRLDGKSAVRCFLSYADAVLAAAILRATVGLVVAPAKAAQFGIEAFRLEDQYLAILHVGWAAHQGQLLVSEEQVFATLGIPLRQPAKSPALSFEVDDGTLAMVGELYQHAGMFVWREMLNVHADKTVFRRALDGIKIARLGTVEQDQYAFFNADSGEWHFLPVAGPEYETLLPPAN